ncbi:hypothetical protein ASE01_10375 [Nocardioides sp. Root190]|uniref:hypothetical protein n=1 Tax=Nocardioides sp. Root190 TaxID=1736488 RepID=UPI0006F24280|nr:hypothetical protein [Nocardioides sp. Root190]KRB77144.1 hypothetical protein ASE01_10375 [Nocardioides sp. Root190]
MRIQIHRTSRLLCAAGLILTVALAGCGKEDDAESVVETSASEAATPEAALAGAAWLESQLVDGVLVNREYKVDDYSTTVELAYALRAVAPESAALPAIEEALAAGVDAYASPGEDVYAGSTGKLVAFAADAGVDPRGFGGEDLVAQLEARTNDDGPAKGRIVDQSSYGDYANSFGQAWAVRGLTLAGSEEAAAARDYLLQQQCTSGFVRLYFPELRAKDQTCDGAGAAPEPVDTTALAYVLLHDLAAEDPILAAALDNGINYILDQQAEDGSFSGGDGSVIPNTNSTGLAGWALHLAGEDEAAADAAVWVRGRQLGACEGELAKDAGAIGYDDAAVISAGGSGLTVKTEYQWRLSTAQSLPALLATPEGTTEAPCPKAS